MQKTFRKQYHTIVLPMYQGFIDDENQIACYTDHRFLNVIKFSIKNGYSKNKTLPSKNLNLPFGLAIMWRILTTELGNLEVYQKYKSKENARSD